jgi:hypothetical protein
MVLALAVLACCSPGQPDVGTDATTSDADVEWPLENELRGVRFNPETPATTGGVANVDPWLARYDEPDVRAAVRQELRAIRRVAHLTFVTLVLAQVVHFDWPTPTAPQLDHLVAFVDDANEEGLKVALLISHPCVIPNSIVENAQPPVGPNEQHVGGHRALQVVNNETIYWDVPRCEDTFIDDAIGWWDAILTALERRRVAEGMAYVAHAGRPTRPYTLEMNLNVNYRFLDTVLAYLERVIPAMRTHGIPIGVSTVPARTSTDPVVRYSFLESLQRAVPIEQLDVIDMTSWVDGTGPGDSIDPDAIVARVGEANAGRVLLSDFNFRGTTTTWEDAAAHLIAMVHGRGFAGYWIWHYKDDAQYVGIRARGATTVDEAGWRPGILAILRADAMR